MATCQSSFWQICTKREEFIKNLGFGKTESVPENMELKEADRTIRLLRRISREGQLTTQKLQSEGERKGFQIWQQANISDPKYHQAFASDEGE